MVGGTRKSIRFGVHFCGVIELPPSETLPDWPRFSPITVTMLPVWTSGGVTLLITGGSGLFTAAGSSPPHPASTNAIATARQAPNPGRQVFAQTLLCIARRLPS